MITTTKHFTMTCELCKSIATSTKTTRVTSFIKWARALGWEVHDDGETLCSLHRTRKSPLPSQGPVQLDLFDPEPNVNVLAGTPQERLAFKLAEAVMRDEIEGRKRMDCLDMKCEMERETGE